MPSLFTPRAEARLRTAIGIAALLLAAGGIELDCRYCHAGVEQGAGAGMPTAETCLGCHRGARVLATRASPAPPMPSHRRPAAG